MYKYAGKEKLNKRLVRSLGIDFTGMKTYESWIKRKWQSRENCDRQKPMKHRCMSPNEELSKIVFRHSCKSM